MMQQKTFDARWTHIQDQYKAKIEAATGYLDQNAAKLFAESGWTQQKIADHVGKTQQWVGYRLCFGRFLEFTTNVVNLELLPKNLTEGKFRKYWNQTEGRKNEPRFRKVIAMMQDDLILSSSPKNIGKQIADDLADNKTWYHFDDLCETFELADNDRARLTAVIQRIRESHAHGLLVVEKPSTGGKKKYRFKAISEKARKASAAEVIQAIKPYVDDAMQHINAKISQDAVGLTLCDLKNIRKTLKEYEA